MRTGLEIRIICALLMTCAIISVVNADLTQSMSPITGKVYVSGETYEPAVFFTGDKGTATFVVMNANTNTSVMMNHGTFSDEHIRLVSGSYDYSNTLGPLQSRSFVFTVVADAPEGNYYPTFSLSFYDSNLYHRNMVQIDNTPIELTLVDKPDAFSQGRKKTIYMQVANPRKNDVRNVVLEASGPGIIATPARTFVGNLASGAKVPVNFTISPDRPATLSLVLKYDNGDNPHTVEMDLPVTFGIDKKQADPVISNVQVKSEIGTYHITGDVNNAGLETANTVMVTALSPAIPQDPYKSYVVGALKPDDFGSFEVTFSAPNALSVPLLLSYKDTDGNVYTSTQDVNISATGTTTTTGAGSSLIYIGAALLLVAVFVGGWIFHLRKIKK